MVYYITSQDNLFNEYFSNYFSYLNKYWCIKKHLHGHKASTIIKYLKISLLKLSNNNITPYIDYEYDENEWIPSPKNFATHLQRFLNIITELIKNNPLHANVRYYCNICENTNYSDVISEPDI